MKTLLKQFAFFMAVILALSTFGFDVQAVATTINQELETAETIQSEGEEETEPEEPATGPSDAEDDTDPTETEGEPEAPGNDPTLEPDEPDETVPTDSLEDQDKSDKETTPASDKTEKLEEPVEPEETFVDSGVPADPMVRSRVAGLSFMQPMSGDEDLEPGETRFSKTAQTIPGLVNTWEVTVRLEARNKEETSDIVLVIDASTSMAGNKLTNAKTAAKKFVSTLLGNPSSNVRIAIVVFGTGILDYHDFRGPDAANVTELNTFIDNIRIGPGIQFTHTQAAIRQADTLLDGSIADHKNIVLLSDGQPTRSYAIKQSYRDDPSWRSGYLSQQSVPNQGTRWATRDNLLEDHFDYTTTVGSGGDMFVRYDNPSGTSDDKYYNHGNHAIAQARIAKEAGYTIYTVALEAGNVGTPVLNSIASPGKSYSGSAGDLNTIFQQIAGSIMGVINDGIVVDPMGDGFEIPGSRLSDIQVTQGTAPYNAGTRTITWNLGGPLNNYVEGSTTVRYAELKYIVEINDGILTADPTVPGGNLFKTNGQTKLTYTDPVTGAKEHIFTSPEVDPVLLHVGKNLKNAYGDEVTDGRIFHIRVTNGSTYDHTYQVKGGETLILTNLRKTGTYTVSEVSVSGTPASSLSDYDTNIFINGVETSTFTVSDYVSLTQGDPDVKVQVKNEEKRQGKLTVKKIFINEAPEEPGGFGPMSTLSFDFVVTGPGGFNETFSLEAGEDKVFTGLYYGQYTVLETTTGFITTYNPAGGVVNLSVAQKEATVIVTNQVVENIDVVANKIWLNDGGGPHPEIWFKLYRSVKGETATEVPGSIKALPSGTTQVTWESIPEYDTSGNKITYTVKEFIKDENDNFIDAAPEGYEKNENGLTVTNTYSASGKWKPEVSKNLSGRTLLAGEFTFHLYLLDAQGEKILGSLMTATNTAGGAVIFDEIFYDETDIGKTYKYVIEEIDGNLPGVSYDLVAAEITVVVTNLGKGDLSVSSSYSKTVFNNGYSADDVDVDLGGSKNLEGRNLVSGEFEFNLYHSDANGVTGAQIETVSNVGANFSFTTLTFEDGDEGTNYYLIKEVLNNIGGITYDLSEYLVKVVITDDDEGNLEAAVTYWIFDEIADEWVEVQAVAFNNDYAADDVDVDLGGTKNLEGRDLVNGEFEFELYESDVNGIAGTLVQTVSNVGANFSFDSLSFVDGEEGTYYYLIKEVDGLLGGVTYDLTEYLVKVIITDDGEGQLEAAVTYWVFDETADEWVAAQTIVFNNDYGTADVKVDLGGTKNLEGRALANGEFEFNLYHSDANGTTGAQIQTVSNVGTAFNFSSLTYEDGEEGTYYYLIKEVAAMLGGITYDLTEFLVKVIVTDDGAGNLEAAVTYWVFDKTAEKWVAADAVVFNNDYNADDVEVGLAGTKSLEGRDLADDEFEFLLYESDENGNVGTLIETVSNVGANFSFDTISFADGDEGTYYYLIKEVDGGLGGVTYDLTEYLVKVVITDDGVGNLQAAVTFWVFDEIADEWVAKQAVSFANDYEADDVDVSLSGRKNLEGRNLIDGEFEFNLYHSDENGATGGQIETVSNVGSVFNFSALTFVDGEEGTYYYLIKEVLNNIGGISYDLTEFLVKVIVTDDDEGQLEAAVTYWVFDETTDEWVAADAVVFNNDYNADDVEVDLAGTKSLEGRDLADDEFEFSLYESDVNGEAGTLVQTVSNVGANFSFSALSFADGDEGTYYYLIKEVEGLLGGVTYDLTTYLVKVIVTDDGAGNLEAAVTYWIFDEIADEWVEVQAVAFNNDYEAADVEVDLDGTKNLEGRDLADDEFEFELYESDVNGVAGTPVQTVSNVGANFSFSALSFTDGDEGTYYYLIKEVDGSLGGVTYDLTEYLVRIVVTDDGVGNLEAAVTYWVFDKTAKEWVAADAVVYNNNYNADDVDVTLGGTKNLTGRNLADGEFEFNLYHSNVEGVTGAQMQTVSNVGSAFNFTTISFADGDEGTYYYLIKEVAAMLGGISYDMTEYLVKVVVTDDGAGNLEAAVTYWTFDESTDEWITAQEIVFNNSYEADDINVDLGGTKVLEGRDLADGEFEFNLYVSDELGTTGSLIETVGNYGGFFDFSTITFEDGDEGTYYYLIKEVDGGLGGVDYDLTEYLVKVVITDDGKGQLEAAVTYLTFDDKQDKWFEAQAIAFNNDYLAADVEVDLGGTKALEGRDLVDGEFKFELYVADVNGVAGALIETVSNMGAIFSFNALSFEDGDEGTYYYLIKEVEGLLGGVTYDLTEYLVKVVITDDGEGQLEAAVTYWVFDETTEEWVAAQAVVFNNSYLAADVDVNLAGTKALDGRDLADGEFAFNLYLSDELSTIGTLLETVNNVGAAFSFSTLTFEDGDEGTYYYLIMEVLDDLGGVTYDLTEYLVKVVITDDGEGQLEAAVTYWTYSDGQEAWVPAEAIAFNNDYLAADVDIDLGGVKNLEGRELNEGEFEFNLYKSDEFGTTGAQIETVSNVGANFSFSPITFEDGDEGTYYYLIKEVLDGLGGVTYDHSEYLVEVIITDDGVGNLHATVSYWILDETEEWIEVEAVVFNNDYLAADVDVDLGGMKNLEGRELIDGEFEFNLYESDESASTGALLETVSNMGPYFDFSTITFSDGAEGIYLYLIKEVAAMLGGVTYDFTEYLVQVEITDDGEGNLVAEVRYLTLDETETWRDVEAVVFYNDYVAADVEIDLGGMKTLEGRDLIDGEFEFELYEFFPEVQAYSLLDTTGNGLIETVSNVGANFNFSPITFVDSEEGYYYYLIKEVVGTLDGVMYDLTEYMVEVIITDNGEGQLEAEVSYWMLDETEEWLTAEAVVFSNRYINPELEVEKMVEETSFSEAGDELHYSFQVTNTGNLAFIKLTVNDPRLGIVDLVIDLTDPLLPGESYLHVFSVPYVVTEEDVEAAAPIINTLTVVGETEEGFEDEDEDDVIVPFEQIDPITPPILALEKLAHEKSFAKAGDLIHYYFKLTNEGIVPVVNLTVNDAKLGIVDLVIDLGDDPLMPGDTLTYEFAEAYVVTEADVAAGKVENVLTIIGESPDGAEDEVTDDLVVPMEKILPHVPPTGEYITHWYGLSTLLGGALLLVLSNRRRQFKS